MIKNLLTACFLFILSTAVVVAPALAFDQPATPPGQSEDGPGNSGNAPGQEKDKDKDKDKDQGQEGDGDASSTANGKKAKITWDLSKSEVADALLSVGWVVVPCRTSTRVENVGFWLTPSLEPYLVVLPEQYAVLEPDPQTEEETCQVEIRLREGERPTKTIGGTLHVVPTEESADGLRQTYSKPLPINVKFRSETDDTEDGEEPVEETTLALVSSASYDPDAPGIAPLQLVSIFGFGIGPDDFSPAILDEEGEITDYLADVQVFFDGTASPILFASKDQLNVIVPSDVAGKDEVTLTVTYQGQVWEVSGIPVLDAVPEIFTMTGLGHGLAAAVDSNGQLISEDNPVVPGDWIMFFGTGVGLWKDGFIDGTIVDPENLPEPKKPVEVMIGGVAAEVLYIGGAPGMAQGVVQFNVVVPELPNTELDESTGLKTAQIKLTSGGHPSKADIFIYIAE